MTEPYDHLHIAAEATSEVLAAVTAIRDGMWEEASAIMGEFTSTHVHSAISLLASFIEAMDRFGDLDGEVFLAGLALRMAAAS